ncbi:hypothetical protein BDY17DRAFT_312586 [Neohortaea acidophila]|uniref:Zn(2)-C6 fungal-type domain-containing protein n=1 Tax=Neohortaea acidophila TaxID=245834 RepID=A0A6A6PM73_9PEZI|nr:uncharacterized protein BDY17DRAFT_312586 [Neohortaea acidophila]KAF2480754.1 hypothetical protein BDY17DRAFT_312586 [Neohortaea acidophila]
MNNHQARYSPYPPQQQHAFTFAYPPYAQPTSQAPPVGYQYHQQPPPPPVSQQLHAPHFSAPYKPGAQGFVAASQPAPSPAPGQFRPQVPLQPISRNITSSSPPLTDNGPGAPPPEPTSPDEQHQDDDSANEDHEGQYAANGSDEHGAIFNIPPPPENTYPNEEELEKAIHEWSKEHGYELVRRASKRNARGVLYKRYYHCSKHGKRANTGKLTEEMRQRTNRKSGRVDCPMSLAAVAVDPTNPAGEWQIRHRKSHHNHGPLKAVELAGHRRRARMGAVEQAIDGLFAIGTSTAQVLQFLQTTHPDGLFTRTDVANMKNRYKKWGTCADRIQRGENHISTVRYKNQLGIPIPCIPCRQRKYNCGSERPTCKNCQQNGFACEYSHEQPANNESTPVEDGDAMHTEVTPDIQLQQEIGATVQPAPNAPRAQTSAPTPDETERILNNLRNFQAEHIKPQRLTLDSSSVEVLAQSSCGNGDSYRGLPFLNTEHDWPAFRDAMIEAALKENTHDVLRGIKTQPTSPPGPREEIDVETWNEYIRQLAIFNRRNSLLLSALLSKTSPMFRNRVQTFPLAAPAWDMLEQMCAPRGCTTAYQLYCDLHATTLAACTSLQNYISRLDSAYAAFTQLKLNTSPPSLPHGRRGGGGGKQKDAQQAAVQPSPPHTGAEAMTEEMLVFLFLRGLGREWSGWTEAMCMTNNIGGFGTGDRLGFKEVCKAALRQEALARRSGGTASG